MDLFLFSSESLFFSSEVWSLHYIEVLHFLVSFINSYFILTEATVNSGVSTISSVCLLLVCRKVIELGTLILYSATLLDLINPKNFLVEIGESLMYSFMSSAGRERLTSFPVCIPLIFFSLQLQLVLGAQCWKGVRTVDFCG